MNERDLNGGDLEKGIGDLAGVLREAVVGIRGTAAPEGRMAAFLERAASRPVPADRNAARRPWRFAALIAGVLAAVAIVVVILQNQRAEEEDVGSSVAAGGDSQPSPVQGETVRNGKQRGAVSVPSTGIEAAPGGGSDGAKLDGAPKAFGAAAAPEARRTGGLGAGATAARTFAVAEKATITVGTGEAAQIKQGAENPYSAVNRLHVWDWSKGGDSRVLPVEAGNFAVSPDGKAIVTSDGRSIDVATGEVHQLPNFDANVCKVKFSPDGKTVVLQMGTVRIGQKATIRLIDFRTGAKLLDIPDQFVFMFDVAFTPGGNQLVVMSHDMTIRRFDATTGKELMKYEPAHTNSIRSIAISPDGTRLATAGPQGEVFLWELETGKFVGKLKVRYPNFTYDDHVFDLAFSPNSKYLAGSGLVRLILWDAKSGEVEQLFQSWQSGGARHIRFSDDGGEIICIHGFQAVNKWKVERRL